MRNNTDSIKIIIYLITKKILIVFLTFSVSKIFDFKLINENCFGQLKISIFFKQVSGISILPKCCYTTQLALVTQRCLGHSLLDMSKMNANHI